MRFPGIAAFAFAALMLAAPASHAEDAGDFDYYVFTLSCSPGFCGTGVADKSPEQCGAGVGTGFVVHGLWPNRSYGANPENCQYGVRVPREAIAETDGVYPDEGLARY